MAVEWPAATALIQLLAWELPYATGVALKKNFFKNSVKPTQSVVLCYGSRAN